MSKLSNQKETIVDYQSVVSKKKLKKIFKYIDPAEEVDYCPVRDIFSVVSDKWSVLIIGFLGQGETIRFNELKKMIQGISSKILSERLKRLERDGYVRRKVYAQVPIKVEYNLTSLGHSYLVQLLSFGDWIEKFAPQILENRKIFGQK